MTEQELREQFEKWEKDRVFFMNTNPMFHAFKQGYSLAQETIAELESKLEQSVDISVVNELNETIVKARFFISSMLFWLEIPIERRNEIKAWLENNC